MEAIDSELAGPVDTTTSPYARLRTLPQRSVRLTDNFWAPRQELNRQISLPSGYQMLEDAGNFYDLRLAAGRAEGTYRGPVYMDSDVYKWLEAAGFELARRPDAGISQMADTVVELLGAAQGADGYLDSYWEIAEPGHRWEDLGHGHELYCLGHLIQAAVAFHRGTGDSRLIEIARRFADYVDSVFGPGKRAGTPGHPEVEMALIELYRDTRERRYLDLARYFIDQRGHGLLGPSRYGGGAYYQDHEPVREASTLEGHAVRALYLTTGIADLYLETGEEALKTALERQWDDLTQRKIYVTGGIGARHLGEAFGEPYELPSDSAYSETCAAIANVMWNWRMLLATGEGRFADLLERSLYNAVLSGISLDGCHYFYVNPLRSGGVDANIGRKTAVRTAWHSCACCPPNVMRLLASLDHYVATRDDRGVQLHLYAASALSVGFGAGRRVGLQVETDYPWEGGVKISVTESDSQPWQLSLRLPSWSERTTLAINGKDVTVSVRSGYASIERIWRVGDVVELGMALEPRLVEAHPRVDAARRSVAIERGPLIYCLEQVDQASEVRGLDVEIDERAPLQAHWEADLLGGIVSVDAIGYAVDTTAWPGGLYAPLSTEAALTHRPVRLKAVPYFAWANRGPSVMRVWIPRASQWR